MQNKALDLMAEASREAIKIAASQGKQMDPLEGLVKFAAIMSDLKPATDSGLLKVLLEAQQRQQDLMMKLLQQEHGGDSLEKQLAVFERLSGLLDRFAPRGGRGSLWEALLQAAPSILGPVASMVNSFAALRGGVAPTAPYARRR